MTLPRIFRTSSFRLALAYAGLFALSTAVLFAIVYWIATDSLEAQARAAIDREMTTLLAEAGAAPQRDLAGVIDRAGRDRRVRDLYFGLQDATGVLVAGNLPVAPAGPGWILLEGDDEIGSFHPVGEHDEDDLVLFARVERLGDGSLVTVASDVYPIAEAQEAIVLAFAWAGTAMLLLALGGGVVLSRTFLRRIDDLNRTVAAIMAGRLSERIRLRGSGDEIDRLGLRLNEMLDRLEASMEGLRQVSDDIAHDLRTPLGRLKQQLEALKLTATTPEAFAEGIEAALEQVDTALATFAALLRIAQIESGSARARFRALDLSSLLERLATTYTAVAEDLDHRLTARIAPGLWVHGEPALLTQMAVNLIENALRHTPNGTAIALELRPEGREVELLLRDSGPGIPEAERGAVLRRFYRLDRSRATPGSGLGLALAAAVAGLHGSVLRLEDNRPGLAVSVRLPLSAQGQV